MAQPLESTLAQLVIEEAGESAVGGRAWFLCLVVSGRSFPIAPPVSAPTATEAAAQFAALLSKRST